jgi:maltooligosyltrehalose trehalohydrolase
MTPSVDRVAAWTPTLGAVPLDEGANFAVWAPEASAVDVVFEHERSAVRRALVRRPDGTFSGWAPDVEPGARYRFSVDGRDGLPDPASRWKPDGVHGASAFVNPFDFVWTDDGWNGVRREDLIVYELHVGAFSP